MKPRLLTILLVALAVASVAAPSASADTWYTLNKPIDPTQLTALPFGTRSYWLQPWRSSLTTRPATFLQNAIGINFNVWPNQAAATARLLHDSGVRRARIEFPWAAISYANPSEVADPSRYTTLFTGLRDNGIRPLVLLNANSGQPGPMLSLKLKLTAPAAQGAKTIGLDSGSAAQVVPGLTGINYSNIAANTLITQVNGAGVATLSRPLPAALPAGPVAASTLRYQPFAPPYLASGAPNPRFQQTLAGWLSYVKTVCQLVRNAYGSDNFDVEVWNELGFGSAFLFENNYYNPLPDPGSTGDVTQAILQATIQMLRNPTNGLTDVKVGDGFSNQIPWTSGTTVPPGTDAFDHHPYQGSQVFPGREPDGSGVMPVNALGQKEMPYRAGNGYYDLFVPSFRVFMPEYFLNGIQTETLMRDLSPMQTTIYGTPHGAGTHPTGSPPPTMWVTEANLDQGQALQNGLPAADMTELQAKTALRYYVSYASAGASAIDLFAATGGGCCQIISQNFFNAVYANPSSYPSSLGGLTMQAVGRMTSTLAAAQSVANPRQLTLEAIASNTNDSQFTGNGTAAFPDLYNRDVLAFFPFQMNQNEFVAAVYVMTRDLTHYYTASPAAGSTSYDLPPEQFRLTVGNVNGLTATVSLMDPLTGTQQPATIVSRDASDIVVQLPVTDSPRMLTIDDSGTQSTVSGTTVVTPAQAGAPSSAISPASSRAQSVNRTSHGLTVSIPAKVSAKTARSLGISVNVRCARSCRVSLVAEPVGRKAGAALIVGQAIAQLGARKTATVKLTLTPSGRAWLHNLRRATRVRITARDTQGATVTKLVGISGHGRRKQRPKRHKAAPSQKGTSRRKATRRA